METTTGSYALPVEVLLEEVAKSLSPAELKESLYLSEISAKLTLCRIKAGLTKKEFAARLGVSPRLVSQWEKAEHDFTIGELTHICEKLGFDFSVQIRDVRTPQQQPLDN